MAQNIFITLLLVFLNGFFVAAEFALVKIRLSQLEIKIRNGSRIAIITKNLVTHLDAYLSATQLGITLASLGLGWIGEPVTAKLILDIFGLTGIPIPEATAHSIALPTAFIVLTFLHIILGELIPKSLAIRRSERIAMTVALPLRAFYIIFSPFILLLNTLANLFLKLLGFKPVSSEEGLHSAEELRFLLEEGSKSGAIEPAEHKLLENIFEFVDTPVKQIMVPRGKIVAIEVSAGYKGTMQKFSDEGYSRLPAYEQTVDNIIGVIYAKDMLNFIGKQSESDFRKLLRKPFFVLEDELISKLLRDMQKAHIHIAVVQDEFGGTAGLVTLEDILEEIVGEIQDEYDEESPNVEKLSDLEFIVKTSVSIDDANDELPVPLPESEDYETVGGLINSFLGRIPDLNEIIELEDYTCTILKRSKRRIELVKLKLNETAED